MYYWNDKHLEGMKQIGENYLSKDGYEDYANYCLLIEKGLRKSAINSLNKFISSAKEKSVAEQRELATELIVLDIDNSHAHKLLPHPLQQYLIEVLKKWSEEEKFNVIPHRWLGWITGDVDSFEKALEIDPTDTISIMRLAQVSLNNLDFMTHHLSESVLLGEVAEARYSIKKASEFIERLREEKLKAKMLEDLEEYILLINAWEEYSLARPPESFPDWCKSKGVSLSFGSIVFYEK